VKLTPWSEAVKPDPTVLLGALVSATLTALALLLAWTLLDPQEERLDRFGGATARALGELALEPLLKQDRLHLGVIGNRLVEMDEITAVATYTVDHQLLTLTGSMTGPQYAESISIDDTVIGHVRIALDPDAFDGGITAAKNRKLAATVSAAIAIVAALLTAVAGSLVREWRGGRLAFDTPGLGRRLRERTRPASTSAPALDPNTAPPEVDEEPPIVLHYLLAVNLYNQLSLQGVEREFELSLCTELAEAVALEYQGQVVSLPGLGALVDFDHTEDAERVFDVVQAGYVLARLLRDEAPFGIYRLGLHLVSRSGDEPLPLNHPAVTDVALLSALAPDTTLALSETLCAALEADDRLLTRPMSNVLLEELTTSGTECQLLTDLTGADKTEALQQVEALKTQRDSIASESTF